MQILGVLKLVGWGAVGAVLIYGGPPPGPGYLPGRGPTALRFRAEMHANPAAILPPLRMSNDDEPKPEATISIEETNAHAMQAQGIHTPEVFADLAGDLALDAGEIRSLEPQLVEPTESESAANNIIAPQMLLRYFNRSTNAATYISVPVEFTPPQEPQVRGSSATYVSE